MTIKKILTMQLLLLSIFLFGQEKSGQLLPGDFGKIKFDSVVAYQYQKNDDNVIALGKKLNYNLVSKAVTLNKSQIDTLRKILFNTKTYGAYPPGSCWKFNLGFVFFSGKKITASVSVSFECNNVFPSEYIQAMEYESFSDKKYGFAYYTGLSNRGKNAFMRLCDQVGLSYPKSK